MTKREPAFPIPRPNPLLISALGRLNRWVILPRRLRIARIDLPPADQNRLMAAVNPGTAAFIVPNHPEFGLDWMLDKEVSIRVAPRMAAWASHDIVASAPWFWTRNNLVSNRGGAAARAHSVAWALAGNGVLLHPEGMVRWTADYVHPLFAGAAQMALDAATEAARSDPGRAVYIVPIIWKVRYETDVTDGMHSEMAYIERSLGLARGDGCSVSERFRRLQEQVLSRQMTRFGFSPTARARTQDFFARQHAFRQSLVADLQRRHPVAFDESLDHLIHRLSSVVTSADDRARVREAERLGTFSASFYAGPTLSQEQIHECLKRLRADLLRQRLADTLHNFLPKPYGRRVAHVRVPNSIPVEPAPVDGAERAEVVRALLERLRAAMQGALDDVNREIAPLVDHFRHQNPFHIPAIATRSAPPRLPEHAGMGTGLRGAGWPTLVRAVP